MGLVYFIINFNIILPWKCTTL